MVVPEENGRIMREKMELAMIAVMIPTKSQRTSFVGRFSLNYFLYLLS